MGSKLTTQQFIERAQSVHGNRYDYSTSVFEGTMKKIAVRCSTHGVFHQTAMDHMNGRGCAQCNERQQLTKQQFIDRANAKHNSKYTYDDVVFVNVTTKVNIVCPTHGVFTQTPKDHMHKYGCPACGGTAKVTTDQFINRAVTVHGDTYDYTAVNLTNMNKNVHITCRDHGIFTQRPADHLNGVGCPTCGTYKQGKYTEEYFLGNPSKHNEPAHLYLITVGGRLCKLGITKKQNVRQRFPGLVLTVEAKKPTTLYEAFKQEQRILSKYAVHRYKEPLLQGTHHSGWTECFPLSMLPQLKAEIEAL